jgi:hypothetical protein
MTPDRRNGHGPNLAGGVLILDPRDQAAVKDDLRKHGEQAKDWEWHEQHQFLHRWANIFKDRFLDPVLLTDRRRMPDPVISFDSMNVRTLAGYTLNRNPQGLLDEITFNTKHIVEGQWRYGQWGMLETLLHEQVHLYQQNFGDDPYIPGKSKGHGHNKEFVDKCESLGLHPLPDVGAHWKQADGLFQHLMYEYGIERPEGEIPEDNRIDWWKIIDLFPKAPKGRSSLTKWTCETCGMNLRVGVRTDIRVICGDCRDKLGYDVWFVRG